MLAGNVAANVPRASASIAALTMLAGLALIYWGLSGLGVIVDNSATLDKVTYNGGGFSGGSSGTGSGNGTGSSGSGAAGGGF